MPDATRNPVDARTAALGASADALARAPSLDSALATILAAAAGAVGAERGAIFLQDPDRPAPELIATFGLDAAQVAGWRDALGNSAHPVTEAARTRTAAFDRQVAGGQPSVAADLPLVVSRDVVSMVVRDQQVRRREALALDDRDERLERRA